MKFRPTRHLVAAILAVTAAAALAELPGPASTDPTVQRGR